MSAQVDAGVEAGLSPLLVTSVVIIVAEGRIEMLVDLVKSAVTSATRLDIVSAF